MLLGYSSLAGQAPFGSCAFSFRCGNTRGLPASRPIAETEPRGRFELKLRETADSPQPLRASAPVIRSTGRRPASVERPRRAGRTRQGSPYRGHGSRDRLRASRDRLLVRSRLVPVRATEGRPVVFFPLAGCECGRDHCEPLRRPRFLPFPSWLLRRSTGRWPPQGRGFADLAWVAS
jgi:hypothetical protein